MYIQQGLEPYLSPFYRFQACRGARCLQAYSSSRAERRRPAQHARVIVSIQRLIAPGQVELIEDAAHALRSGLVPWLVGIDHNGHGIAIAILTALTRL